MCVGSVLFLLSVTVAVSTIYSESGTTEERRRRRQLLLSTHDGFAYKVC